MTEPQSIEEANAMLARTASVQQQGEPQSIEEANAMLARTASVQQQGEPQSIEEANAALGIKPELGMFERIALKKQAQTGKEASFLDYVPVFGGIRQAEQNRQEAMEQKLFAGEYRDTLEASRYALSLGIPQEEVRRINGLGDDAAIRKGFSDAVKDRFAARIRSREEAQRKLQGAKEAGWFEEAASGLITGGAAAVEFANPVTMAIGTAGKIINKIGDKGRDIYTLDEKGNPVIAKDENGKELRGDRSERAAIGAIASGYGEQTIWTAMGLKQLGSLGVKVIDKIPGVKKIAAAGVGKLAGAVQGLAGKIATTEGGRTALKTLEVVGKVNDKLHFGSLPDMIYKSRLTELTDALTTSAPEEMRQNLAKWVDDFTSVRGNAELLTGIIGIHLLTAGYGAFKARRGERAFRHLDANGREGGREELVAEYIGAEKAKQLSDVDLDNIYRLVTSPELSEGKISEFVEKLNRDQAEAQKKIDAGESVASVIEGIRERAAAGSQGIKTAAERIKETLENKAKLTPEMEDALDGKIEEYTKDLGTSGEAVAKMVKDDILANVKDNAVYEQTDMLDELVAMSMRKFNGEGRRLRIHDVRGETNAGEQLKTINELGITSWEQAEAEGLVTRDKYGRLGGGARRALNIALHGTEKLQNAVKDGTISGELAEDLMTAAQCELGARPVEEQTALVDGILERANGDEALARRMLEKLETESGRESGRIDERLDQIAEKAKVDAIKERNGAADETARGAAVEPVETEDGQIKTVGEVVDADTSIAKKANANRQREVWRNLAEAIGGIVGNTGYGILRRGNTEIRFELGKSGKKGMGAMHIVESRMQKDGLSLDEAAEIAVKVGEAAVLGEETLRRYNTIHYDYNGVRAIVAEMPDGSKVITGYEIKADAESGANRRPDSLRTSPHVSSEEVVAALKRAAQRLEAIEPPVVDIIANFAANVNAEPKPTTALGGAEQADRLAGTKLTVFNGMTMGCETFPEAKVNVSADGVTVRGLTADTMAKPENVADVAAFLTHLMRISKRNGIRIEFEDADAAKIAQALVTEISQQGAAKTMAKLETRGKLFGILFKTTLGNGVTYDEASFKEALKNVSNGRQFVDNHGDVYGFVDGEGVLHFNPATFRMDTPLHEYGHLALEATKKVNNALWKKGNALIKESQYYRDLLSEIGQDKNSPYREMDEEGLCDEALARMIGDRGAKLVEEKGLDAQLKGWLKEVWKAFKGALGIADLTEEQIERMTVGDFVDTINAELLKGSEFGTKKQKPLEKRSIKRYDEDQTSGSNGVLRWKNDRGYLFAIPVDIERTQPGGKVVFATDDANITDWIQNALNGYTLRLSKSGKLYVEGRDGLPGELAEIFGRYPTIGQNDGIYGLIAGETGNRVMDGAARDMTPEVLVEALRKDRANYDAWKQGRDAEAEHWAMEEARENAEAASRWEQSGMSVMDYIRSRVEEGDPAFDLDWETAREIERDRAMGRFSIGANDYIGWNQVLDRYESGKIKQGEHLTVWKNTPVVLKALGVPDLPIRVDKQILDKITGKAPTSHGKRHSIPVSDLRNVQIELDNPIAVFDSKTDNNSLVVLTRMVDKENNEKAVVALRINVTQGAIDVNAITSAYGKDKPSIENWTAWNLLRYINKQARKSSARWLYSPSDSDLRARSVLTEKDFSNEQLGEIVPQSGGAVKTAKMSVGRLYTGSAADYEKPSLLKVGTGEGSQVYGWGLYASSERGVAEKYASTEELAWKNGKKIDLIFPSIELEALASRELIKNKGDLYKTLADLRKKKPGSIVLKELENHGKEYDVSRRPNIYEQTFFTNRAPGDESHLLKWYDKISPENAKRVISAIESLGISEDHLFSAFGNDWRGKVKERTGQDAYQMVQDCYRHFLDDDNEPQAASELLAKFDIDGVKYPVDSFGKTVKDGDNAGWNYVSFRDDNINVDHKWRDGQALFSVGHGTAEPDLAFDPSMIVYNPKLKAMGETEQNAGGIAAAIEKKEALRPWTRKDSPCDLAKPIAMDMADMVQFIRAINGAARTPIIRKGDHIPGRKNAIGLNRGGTQIELANRLFGMVDASDVGKLKTDCANDGYFRHENPDWCAAQTKDAVKAEAERSQDELDRRTRDLIRHRVATGEGGMHYATQVLGHEIGHTIATLPADRNLGAVGNAMRTLYDALQREMKRAADPLRVKKGEPNLTEEIDNLITWWHGADTLPDYYKKPKEKFAELFGIFLTQPESVHREAPKAYEAIVQMMGKNERLALAYRRITEAKWSGKSNERVMADIERTWTKEQQEQFRELERLAREPISKARDWFNFALNDRFGPMFAISQRSLAAEKKHLARAVKEGAMSQQEANDRIKARQDEIDALKTALYDWQRQTGGSTRLMMADLDDVIRTAERDGVNWKDVRMYAHLNRVIELGGRATAHGVDPSRAAAMLGDMARKLGAEKWTMVEKAWKAYRAVYERHALEDPNVAEMFDAETNKMLYANKHYVTMKHRMGAEETAEWIAKVEAYKKGNQDAWDPTIDLWNRMNRGLKGQSGINAGFKLYRLEGSFEATEDPIAATMKTAIDLKENAARNHLLKTMSQTLRDLGVKGVYDTALADGAKEHAVDPNVYERLTYMDGGIRHELIVPRVIGASFTTRRSLPRAVDFIGGTMRFLRNTMTLWNPAFINRAYLIDKAALETNIKGLHKPAIDILSEALCFRGIGVPLYMANNYLTRFTPIANTWLGKILWNEHTVNHYAHRAQKIARMVYEGRFSDRLEEARKLRELGRTGEATEIEQNVAIAREMLKKNVFQSLYQFDVEQRGLSTDEILQKFGYKIEGGKNPKSWLGRMWERTKNGARIYNRFEEEQEAVTKIVAYLYRMKMDERAGRTSAKDADARARLVIEQGGTPNLSARGVFASAIENATGFFWNVRKEGFLRTVDALKDHPTEWIAKNFAQTAMPALLKDLIVTGCAELLIKKFFDDDEEKIKESWWAPAVLDHCRFVNSAMKCVPGYYQRNYNVIPIAKFGNEVLSMRVKYSPEEFAIQNAIHTAMQKFGADPTDPSADWSTLTQNMMTEFLPNIFGQNYALDAIGALVGPLVGINPYDQYRERKIYDENLFRARAKMPGRMAKEMVKSFWNYSPLGSFFGKLKDGLERKDVNDEIPGWLDGILSTPFVKMLPASMLTITSDDSYVKGLQEVDKEQRAAVMVAAQDILVDCIKRGSLGGFAEGLKDVPGDYRMLAVRHVLNGWRQWHMDPRMKQIKTIRGMKDVELKRRAWQMLKDGERYQD